MLCDECIQKENERLESEGKDFVLIPQMGLVLQIGSCEKCGKTTYFYDDETDREAMGLK